MSNIKISSSVKILLLFGLALYNVPHPVNGGEGCFCKWYGRSTGIDKDSKQACMIALKNCPTISTCSRGSVCRGKPKCSIAIKSLRRMIRIETRDVERMVRGRKRIVRVRVPVVLFRCSIGCTAKRSFVCVKPGGKGDPHLTGFDGKMFDFHGVHGKYYAFFGRAGGDMLITRIRSAKMWAGNGIEKTYFDQFGLKTAGSTDDVSVSLAQKNDNPTVWQGELRVNGNVVANECESDSFSVKRDEIKGLISVRTGECEYKFIAKRTDDAARRHLDVEVSLHGTPQRSGTYVGVLGVTLNHAMGKEVKSEIRTLKNAVALEKALRERFEVDSLFSDVSADVESLSGVVRSAFMNQKAFENGKSWVAMTQQD